MRLGKRVRSDGGFVEHCFVDFVFMCIHHPDFSTSYSDLEVFRGYIQFFMECVATTENISYLYHLISQLKTVRDNFDEGTGLYCFVEVALKCVGEFAGERGWGLNTYSGRVGISRVLFTKLAGKEALENVNTVFVDIPVKKREERKREKVEDEDEDDDEGFKRGKVEDWVATGDLRRSSRSRKSLVELNLNEE